MAYKTIEIERDNLRDTTRVWSRYGDRPPLLLYDSAQDPVRARGGSLPLDVVKQFQFSKIIIK